jgi:hypothetical protein
MAAEVLQQLPQLEALCERLYNSQVGHTDGFRVHDLTGNSLQVAQCWRLQLQHNQS